MTPADYKHRFRTLFGIPPAKDEAPICMAELPDDWSGHDKPECPVCEHVFKLVGRSTPAAGALVLELDVQQLTQLLVDDDFNRHQGWTFDEVHDYVKGERP